MIFLFLFTLTHFATLIMKTKAFKITNSINVSIALSTGIFWGYLFDIMIFHKSIDFLSIIGAILVILGSFINLKEKKNS